MTGAWYPNQQLKNVLDLHIKTGMLMVPKSVPDVEEELSKLHTLLPKQDANNSTEQILSGIGPIHFHPVDDAMYDGNLSMRRAGASFLMSMNALLC